MTTLLSNIWTYLTSSVLLRLYCVSVLLVCVLVCFFNIKPPECISLPTNSPKMLPPSTKPPPGITLRVSPFVIISSFFSFIVPSYEYAQSIPVAILFSFIFPYQVLDPEMIIYEPLLAVYFPAGLVFDSKEHPVANKANVHSMINNNLFILIIAHLLSPRNKRGRWQVHLSDNAGLYLGFPR